MNLMAPVLALAPVLTSAPVLASEPVLASVLHRKVLHRCLHLPVLQLPLVGLMLLTTAACGGGSQEEVVDSDNGPCGVKPALPGVAIGGAAVIDCISHKDDKLDAAASIELGGASSMPAPAVAGADVVDMGGSGGRCTMAGGAALLGVPPSGAVRGSAFSCSTSYGAAPGGGAPSCALWQVLGGAGGAAPP